MENVQPQKCKQEKAVHLTHRQWKRRRMLRLMRNWLIFLVVCAVVMGLIAYGLLKLIPQVRKRLLNPSTYEATPYDNSGYVCDLADARLVLINNNWPMDTEPLPSLSEVEDGVQLEAETAQAYQQMAAAAQQEGITLQLVAGYQDYDTRQAAFESKKQMYLERRKSDEEATRLAASVVPQPQCSEYATGYGADILSDDYQQCDTGFAQTSAYEWLCAYAAEYGFILRWPEDRQAATGMAYEPWHWRYVGRENALAIREAGLSLEEFLAVEQLNAADE